MSDVIEEDQEPQAIKEGSDFSKESVISNTPELALFMTLAQLISALCNIMDQVCISMTSENAILSLTGLGLYLPIISMVIASADLFGMGGAPLCSIERGRGNKKGAEAIMGNAFAMIAAAGILLTVLGLIFKRPMLHLSDANDTTISYADSYITIYLLGNTSVMTGLGMSNFINSQGFGTVGMMTVLSGAIANIVLGPIFTLVFHMGAKGAALAAISSQCLSAVRIFTSFTGKRTILKLRPSVVKLEGGCILCTVGLGTSGFTMAITNSSVRVMYNTMLQWSGRDLYVGIMTVINLVREVISVPVNGVTNSSQPMMGFNHEVGGYGRVRKSIVPVSMACTIYTVIMWPFAHECPEFFIRTFNRKEELMEAGTPIMRVYFFGFFMMSLQFLGQVVFVGLGRSKKVVFFSIFRKVIIVILLILMLSTVLDLGATGMLMAEFISNFIGGVACFGTMLFTVQPELK